MYESSLTALRANPLTSHFSTQPTNLSHTPGLLAWEGHTGWKFIDNVVEGWQPSMVALEIAGATRVEVRGNTFRATTPTSGSGSGGSGGDGTRKGYAAAISVTNASNCVIEGNVVEGTTEAVTVNSASTANITVRNNTCDPLAADTLTAR
jgi:hypothetical protein